MATSLIEMIFFSRSGVFFNFERLLYIQARGIIVSSRRSSSVKGVREVFENRVGEKFKTRMNKPRGKMSTLKYDVGIF